MTTFRGHSAPNTLVLAIEAILVVGRSVVAILAGALVGVVISSVARWLLFR